MKQVSPPFCNKSSFGVKDSSCFQGQKKRMLQGSVWRGLESCVVEYTGSVWGDFTGSAIEGPVKPWEVNNSQNGTCHNVPYRPYNDGWGKYGVTNFARYSARCALQGVYGILGGVSFWREGRCSLYLSSEL